MEIQLSNKESISKADITTTSFDLLEKLETGEVSALALLQKFKAVEKINETVKPRLTELAVLEAKKYPEKDVALYGAVFKVGEFGTKYDFSNCGDPVYTELLANLEEAKKALKQREDFLKNIDGHETVVIEGTGEILTVYPPVKTSTTGVTCSIK